MTFDLTQLPVPLRRVMVTGSRDWPDRRAVTDTLDQVDAARTGDWTDSQWPITLVHGAGHGVDGIADAWAKAKWPTWLVEPHPADWSSGRRGGPQRNAAMVAAGADICLAFIGPCTRPACTHLQPHGSHGASGCAKMAEAAGMPVWRYTPTPEESAHTR